MRALIRHALVSVLLLTVTAPLAHAIILPPNFAMENAVPGVTWVQPVAVAFLPDGRWLVAEKRGRVWAVKDGARHATPLWQGDQEVLNQGDRGLLGLAVDPNYATNRRIYLLYTVDPDSDNVEQSGVAFARLTRYEVSASDSNVVDHNTRTVLLGRTWPEGPLSASTSHTIGTLRFGRDGSLFAGAGDGASFNNPPDVGGQHSSAFTAGRTDPYEDIGALRAQYLGSLAGKILRINPETGEGYPSNPFWDGNPNSVRSRVWAYGVRNPFRFTLEPGTGSTDPADGDPGVLHLGDVGWTAWEDLHITKTGGKNFGWPCYEGPVKLTGYWAPNPQPSHCGCDSLGIIYDNPADTTRPVSSWHHSTSSISIPPGIIGYAAVGGGFYTGRRYPPQYRNRLFMADYGQSWIKVLVTDSLYRLNGVLTFADDANAPIDVVSEPGSGDLVYISISTNQVRRIRYTGPVDNTPPVAVANGAPLSGAAPLLVSFSSAGSSDAENDSLSHSWLFGDGDGSSLADPTHTYTVPGTYEAVLTVSDAFGGIGRDTVVVTVSGSTGFPATAVLDTFDRADGPIGPPWTGEADRFAIGGQRAAAITPLGLATWDGAVFGRNQEVFITLDSLVTEAPEHNLILKAQGVDTLPAHIEVLYDALNSRLQLWTYEGGPGWVQRGDDIGATFAAGDQFGARALVDGTVEAYRNGLPVGTWSVGDWPFAAETGRIGFSHSGALGSRFDDFGGGTLASGPNTPPVATILSPPDFSFYGAGDTLRLIGAGSDLQTPSDSLLYRWEVDLHHNTHVHPAVDAVPNDTALVVTEDHDDGTGVFLRARFIVTDALGLADTTSIDLFPESDLMPSAVVTVPETLYTDQPGDFLFAVRNLGSLPAPFSRWRLTAGDSLLAEADTLVAAEDSVAYVLTLPPTLPAGTYVLQLALDVLGQVFETDEGNNVYTGTLVVVERTLVPPVATIVAPVNGGFYTDGDTLWLKGSATDDRDLPAALTYAWELDFHHDGTVDVAALTAVGDSTYVVPSFLSTDPARFLRVRLLVTDSDALTDTAAVTVLPARPDVVAPVLVSGPVAEPDTFQAVIRWSTDEPAGGRVRWGSSVSLGDSVAAAGVDTAQVVPLTGLLAGTRYYYQVVARDTAGNETVAGVDSFTTVAVALAAEGPGVVGLALSSPYPNPSRGVVRLVLGLTAEAEVRFSVHDLQGRELWRDGVERRGAGRWTLEWKGEGSDGRRVAPGVYYARVEAQGQRWVRRVTMLR